MLLGESICQWMLLGLDTYAWSESEWETNAGGPKFCLLLI